jgi:NAD(P)-dependent dehydrogenase (short-subunit alcohol dehydrogenase family)
MNNKNVLITGGNAGIGLATAVALAREGADVYIVARNREKADAGVKKIIADSGNPRVKGFVADLASQKSIRRLAEEIKTTLPRLDVLINNAGSVFPRYLLSEDGLEMAIATNYFAYFLLTNLLLDLIKKSDYARIVNVASGSHHTSVIDFESFQHPKPYSTAKAYGQSKLADVLFTFKLARLLKDMHVTVNALHPGFVKTHIGNKDVTWYASLLWSFFSNLKGISVEEGAKTSVYLATSPEVKNISGKYFDKCREKEPAALALDVALQDELWERSLALCPLTMVG